MGEQWQIFVKLKKPHAYSNPGSFDYERHLFSKRISAEGRVLNQMPYHYLGRSIFSHSIDKFRARLKNFIKTTLENNSFSGIICALVTGIQTDISPLQWQVLRATGTAHLVAISGLHISLVAGFSFVIARLMWRLHPIFFTQIPLSLMSSMGGVVMAIIYALLAGFSVPTQRAVIMITIFMTARLRKRCVSIWNNYFLALGFVLIIDPLVTLSPGFWLSFGAVGILLYGMGGRINPKGWWYRWGRAQWVISLSLAPITLAIFHTTSFISPVANVIAIPWISFLVVPFCLLAVFCSLWTEILSRMLFKMATKMLSFLWPILEMFSNHSLATWSNASSNSIVISLAILGVFIFLLPKGFPSKILGIIFIFPLILIKPSIIEKEQAFVTVLDVGQGLATVVETKNHVLVFDTGPKLSTHFDTGDKVVLPFLATRNRNMIDTMIISHGDNDHVGGAKSILDNIKVAKIITSEPGLFSHQATELCYAGQKWEWDGVFFEMLHPENINTIKRNDHACVLHIQAGEQSVILTADIEAKSELHLLNKFPTKLQSTVMLVPHHGSKSSSTLAFIRAVQPLFAIIPVGYQNRYGHPKSEVVLRYQQEKILLYDTIQDGAISFYLNKTKKVEPPFCYRKEKMRYWHSKLRDL